MLIIADVPVVKLLHIYMYILGFLKACLLKKDKVFNGSSSKGIIVAII